MRTHHERRTETHGESARRMGKRAEYRQAVEDETQAAALSAVYAAAAGAVNVIARSMLDSLKTGGLLQGTVRSNYKTGPVDAVWVSVEIPMVGERQILVGNDKQLRRGDMVMIECVPILSGTRHIFRIAEITE